MHVLVYMTERQFRSVVHILKMGEEQLLYNVVFWYMDYYTMSQKNTLTNYQVICLPFTRSHPFLSNRRYIQSFIWLSRQLSEYSLVFKILKYTRTAHRNRLELFNTWKRTAGGKHGGSTTETASREMLQLNSSLCFSFKNRNSNIYLKRPSWHFTLAKWNNNLKHSVYQEILNSLLLGHDKNKTKHHDNGCLK